MNTLLQTIRTFEKAAEEMKNAAIIAAIGNKLPITVEQGRELRDRILEGEMNASRAERAILEAVAMHAAMERVKQTLLK